MRNIFELEINWISEIKKKISIYIIERKIVSSINSELQALNNKENIDFYMRPTPDKLILIHTQNWNYKVHPKVLFFITICKFETVQKQTKNFQSLVSLKYLASVKSSAVSSMRNSQLSRILTLFAILLKWRKYSIPWYTQSLLQ